MYDEEESGGLNEEEMILLNSRISFKSPNEYNGPGQDEQPPALRPRSKRQKKLSIKGLYMLEKVNDLIFKHKHKNMVYAWTDSMARF
ncbi:hypothetical protein ZEAMMB73_Zm00001d035460 [Zea mays]|uniref:Uncharacterized protein n=1 Tax=Zea mays TaxID=4577 RepID=A0A1D6LGG3_MAIZE|nr:hypothetical protein ZEAMMB73_Zm00001d035460 [Zea mays]